MSLPGIRPMALDVGGGTWRDHLAEAESSPPQHKQHTLRLNEASPDLSSRDQTHEHQVSQTRHPASNRCTEVTESEEEPVKGRMKRNKPVKWSVEEDRRLRDAVSKVSKGEEVQSARDVLCCIK